MKKTAAAYVGLSGLVLPVPKYKFPAAFRDASRLTYYSSIFNSIEINSSFYKLPLQRTVSRWMKEVPDDFRFTFKLWRELTHCKYMDFDPANVGRFFEAIAPAEKKGCVLIQLPPSAGSGLINQLRTLLKLVSRFSKGWNVAVEFRNKSWYTGEVYDLLEEQSATMVLHDIPKSAAPMIAQNPDFAYVRFHGPTGNYREGYTDAFLSEYASYIKEWQQEGKTVFAYFNNTMGDAFANARTLLDDLR